MRKILSVLVVFFVFEGFSVARSAQELVPAGSWVYDAMASLNIERGKMDFSFRAPMTIQEVRYYFDKIDSSALSEAGKVQYKRLLDFFEEGHKVSFGADLLKLNLDFEANLEAYYKTNDEIGWVYDRYKKKPFFLIPFGLSLGDYCAIEMDLNLGASKGTRMQNDNYLNLPLADVAHDFDLNFPSNVYGCTGAMITENTGFTFRLGMGETSFNRSLSGSVAESEYFTGSAYGALSIFSPNFRYEFRINQFNPDKFMYTHELSAIFFEKLQFTARESLVVFAPLELRYMVPLSIYHGLSPWRDYGTDDETMGGESHTCDYMLLKLEWAACESLRVYGVMAMDQFQAPNESSDSNDSTPNGFGFQAGAESYIPAGKGYVHLWLEGTYTQPYMYIKGSPNWSLCRAYYENVSPTRNTPIYEWLGTPWGPDTVGGELLAGYEVPEKWSLSFGYVFKACGEYSGTKVFNKKLGYDGNTVSDIDLHNWAYPDYKYSQESDIADKSDESRKDAKKRQKFSTPHGTAELYNRFSVRGMYYINTAWTFTVQPSFVVVFNSGNTKGNTETGFEIACSTNYKFGKK